jgi:hypothetical protein
VLNSSGLLSTAADTSGLKIGDNLGLYTNPMARGNASYKIAADLGKVGKALGPAGFVAGTALDGYGVYTGKESYGKAALNVTMGAAAFFPPEGTAISAAYALTETYRAFVPPPSQNLSSTLIFQPVFTMRRAP